MLTKVLDTDDSTALEVGGIKLDRLQFVVAVDDGQIGVGSTDRDTQLDHGEFKVCVCLVCVTLEERGRKPVLCFSGEYGG